MRREYAVRAEPLPQEEAPDVVTRYERVQIPDRESEGALHEPKWPGEAGPVPLFPFRGRGDLVVVVTEHMTVDSGRPEKLRVQVRVVGDVPDVQDAQRPPVLALEAAEPRELFGVHRDRHAARARRYAPASR